MSDIKYKAFKVVVSFSENRSNPNGSTVSRKYEGPFTLDEALQKAHEYHDRSGYSYAVVELQLAKP